MESLPMNARTSRHVIRWGVVFSGLALAAGLMGGCNTAAELTGPGVTAVRDDMAAVNVGWVDGVRRGQVYLVYRGDRPVASLRIGHVAEHSAAGHVFDRRTAPAAGDSITRLVAAPDEEPAKPAIRGQVTRVKGDFVSVDVGSASGLEAGQILLVYRKSGFVANLRIVEVDSNSAAGEVYDKYREPAVDDRVASVER